MPSLEILLLIIGLENQLLNRKPFNGDDGLNMLATFGVFLMGASSVK